MGYKVKNQALDAENDIINRFKEAGFEISLPEDDANDKKVKKVKIIKKKKNKEDKKSKEEE